MSILKANFNLEFTGFDKFAYFFNYHFIACQFSFRWKRQTKLTFPEKEYYFDLHRYHRRIMKSLVGYFLTFFILKI
jgi:hypothetical protein